MKPRGYWGTLVIEFVKVEVMIVLPMLLYIFLVFDLEFVQVFIWGSILGGLFSFALAFESKKVVISQTFQDKEAFLKRISAELEEMGYHLQSQTEVSLTYKPSFMHGHGFFAPKLYVQVEQSSATIVGPSSDVKKLQRRMVLSEDMPDSA